MQGAWTWLSVVLAARPTVELSGVPWQAPVTTSRALQRDLSEMSCLKRATRMLLARRFEANEVNVCAMLYRLSQEEGCGEELGLMAEAAYEVAPRMKSRQLANTARALALKRGSRPRSLAATARVVLERIAAEAGEWERPEEMAMASWAAARFAEEDAVARRALGVLATRAAAAVDAKKHPKEAATVAWALARAYVEEEREAAREYLASLASMRGAAPRDVSTLAWACAKLGAVDWRLGEEARRGLEVALAQASPTFFESAATRDVSQLAAALATASYDSPDLFARIHKHVEGLRHLELGDASAILWASAVLDRPPTIEVFRALLGPASSRGTPREVSLLAWSAAVLAHAGPAYASLAARALEEADVDRLRAPDDLRRLHQALLALRVELDDRAFEAVERAVDPLTRAAARKSWAVDDDERHRASSARHRAVADTLRALKTQHKVVSRIRDEHGDLYVDMLVKLPQRMALVALEFDGPSHFCSNDPRRPLGHTLLKRRLLAARGFHVVSVPYFDWDAIPFWSTMERQRYLQRKLQITETLRYQGGDKSYYSELPDAKHKLSRLD